MNFLYETKCVIPCKMYGYTVKTQKWQRNSNYVRRQVSQRKGRGEGRKFFFVSILHAYPLRTLVAWNKDRPLFSTTRCHLSGTKCTTAPLSKERKFSAKGTVKLVPTGSAPFMHDNVPHTVANYNEFHRQYSFILLLYSTTTTQKKHGNVHESSGRINFVRINICPIVPLN